MSSSLVSVLHLEERSIVAELRASKPFQRLEGIRRLLALYDAQPSVATGLDMPVTAEPDRASGEVINFANTAATVSPAPAAPIYTPPAPQSVAPPAVTAQSGAATAAKAIAMPAPPAAAPVVQVAAMAEAAVADVAVRAPAPPVAMETESASVVSSVRAALLGIGKN